MAIHRMTAEAPLMQGHPRVDGWQWPPVMQFCLSVSRASAKVNMLHGWFCQRSCSHDNLRSLVCFRTFKAYLAADVRRANSTTRTRLVTCCAQIPARCWARPAYDKFLIKTRSCWPTTRSLRADHKRSGLIVSRNQRAQSALVRARCTSKILDQKIASKTPRSYWGDFWPAAIS